MSNVAANQLSIEGYNQRERDAIRRLPNNVVQAFTPALFNYLNYPSRVEQEEELYKFVDVMQDRRFDHYFNDILRGVSSEEFERFQEIATKVSRMCQERFARLGTGRNSLAHSLNVMRQIRFLTAGRPVRVFEAGPGCGYLGALLAACGYPYLAVDVTQAFYLYQNRIWTYLFGDRLIELAADIGDRDLQHDLDSAPNGSSPLIHLPWWDFVALTEKPRPVVDIVSCNHAMCEMQGDSLRYFLKMSRLMLEGSNGPRLLVFEGWGWNAKNRLAWVVEMLYRNGFVIAYNDPCICVAALASSQPAAAFAPLDQCVTTHGLIWANGQLYINEEVKPYCSPDSPITSALQSARGEQRSRQTVSGAQVLEFCASLVGSNGLLTDDERFWDFIERPRE